MPKTITKSRLHSNKNKPKNRQESKNTKSNLPPHLQSFKQNLLSGNKLVDKNGFKFNSSSISLLQYLSLFLKIK